ncbi:hypothetical protein HXZ81_17105 [Myroides odoratimimus]|uniref:hypothetical protein n=1 Tax=Myroides odoratimimus TaxID=76832 RepID=UPI0025755395|nr:hypothetical protein [Myroides odoratimimus]MDM1098318.1 hypothetical protein [Myroides odoratimimus]
MELIVLEGNPSVGKTNTINIVYQLLLERDYKQVINCFQDLGNNDFLDVLEKDDEKIGIVSQGDYAIGECSVEKHLEKLVMYGCKKAICACTVGTGKSRIKKIINNYSNVIILKTGQSIVSLQRIENNMDANKIVYHI